MVKKIFFCGLMVYSIIFISCQQSKKTDVNIQLLNQHIDSAAKLLADSLEIDFEIAREQLSCRIKALYSIDSTVLSMSDEEYGVFAARYANKVDSICDIAKFKGNIKVNSPLYSISEEIINQYADSCAKIIVDSTGVDGYLAKEKCLCALKAFYAVDSTFFIKTDATEIAIFIEKYSAQIDSLCGMIELQNLIEDTNK
ncbi:MAG: hypothetical protein LBN23_00660 [Paludibacter sp.]|nr:hypothetical protein [Paludibacter sp.]